MTKRHLAQTIVLWAVSLFLALVCLRSGLQKLPGDGFWARDFTRWGYPGWFRIAIGFAEIASLILLLIPRLAGYGAGIFTIVMLGAMYTHATHNEFSRLPFNFLLLCFSLLILVARPPALLKKLRGTGSHAEPAS